MNLLHRPFVWTSHRSNKKYKKTQTNNLTGKSTCRSPPEPTGAHRSAKNIQTNKKYKQTRNTNSYRDLPELYVPGSTWVVAQFLSGSTGIRNYMYAKPLSCWTFGLKFRSGSTGIGPYDFVVCLYFLVFVVRRQPYFYVRVYGNRLLSREFS